MTFVSMYRDKTSFDIEVLKGVAGESIFIMFDSFIKYFYLPNFYWQKRIRPNTIPFPLFSNDRDLW